MTRIDELKIIREELKKRIVKNTNQFNIYGKDYLYDLKETIKNYEECEDELSTLCDKSYEK